MTEQEAIKVLDRTKYIAGLPDQGSKWKANAETIALDVAISALEEIQQYRAMEQRLQDVYGDCDGLLETVVARLEKHEDTEIPELITKARLLTDGMVDIWEEYRAIGTVEECREAREKQMANKPLEYESHEDYDDGICPKCGAPVNSVFEYCTDCGQKLDWSEDEIPDSR